eukprot:scaffold2224_cov154-Amphora_coffeaeformis.AAC.4
MDKKDKKDSKDKTTGTQEISPEDFKMAFELRPQQYHSPPSKCTAVMQGLYRHLSLSRHDTTHTVPFPFLQSRSLPL